MLLLNSRWDRESTLYSKRITKICNKSHERAWYVNVAFDWVTNSWISVQYTIVYLNIAIDLYPIFVLYRRWILENISWELAKPWMEIEGAVPKLKHSWWFGVICWLFADWVCFEWFLLGCQRLRALLLQLECFILPVEGRSTDFY